MTIFDNSPERRNLTMLSVAIILFNLGSGKVINGELHLAFLNIEFERTDILMYSIYLFMIWFLFRYWVVFKEKVNIETCQLFNNRSVVKLYKMFVDNSISEARITRHPDGAYYFSATGFQSHKMHIISFKLSPEDMKGVPPL